MNKKEVKKKYCKSCGENLSWKKYGVYRDYCNYDCYVDGQRANRKLTEWFK